MAPKAEQPAGAATAPAEGPLPSAVLDKYKAAAGVVNGVLQTLISKAVDGASVLDLCNEGDAAVEAATAGLYNKVKGMPKGIAFPTSISVNSVLQNFSPLPSDKEHAGLTLAKDDVVKILLGAHFDGYPVVSAETIVVGASDSVTDVRANLLTAAYQASEVALRLVKPGGKNWDVTDGIKKVLAEYEESGIKGVEGILSHQLEKDSIEAKKGIVAFPTEQQRRDSDNAFVFEEGDVYGLNIIVTSGDKTPKIDSSRTTIYQKTNTTYLLKMKASRATFSEISKKAGSFPFTLRTLEEESKARMGVRECVQHNLLKAYEVATTDRPTDLSAQVFVTFTVTKTGAVRLSGGPLFYRPEKVKASVEVKDEEIKATLARPLKPKPVKKKKNGAVAEDGEKEEKAE